MVGHIRVQYNKLHSTTVRHGARETTRMVTTFFIVCNRKTSFCVDTFTTALMWSLYIELHSALGCGFIKKSEILTCAHFSALFTALHWTINI